MSVLIKEQKVWISFFVKANDILRFCFTLHQQQNINICNKKKLKKKILNENISKMQNVKIIFKTKNN